MIRANDPTLHSWIQISPESDFPIQNLPFGIFQTPEKDPRVGVAIGSYVLDMCVLGQYNMFELIDIDPTVFHRPFLNDFMALGRPTWRAIRNRVSELLRTDNEEISGNSELMQKCLIRMTDVEMLLPVKVSNYTDFYSSLEHATHVGQMFRDRENPLLPNWRHLPVGYHGRASSIVVSGTAVHRPNGQTLDPQEESPVFGPTQQLDFELELAFVTGKETTPGSRVSTEEADEHIFGLVLLNDWSARDVQKWEYVPLGPFLSKSFATSISPWVVTLDALEPFRVKGPEQVPRPLPYLDFTGHRHYDINLEVLLQPADREEISLCHTNFKQVYWNMSQQLAHQTSNGCNLQVGDLYASGTISGSEPGSFGSLLELTRQGSTPLTLPDGSQRSFLHDYDTVIMRGFAEKEGIRIGFGEVKGQVLPAV
ncbi:fumarylacetoacetase [Pontibacter beigongshangensis]|uniref:fumarylacetoacetase n=1 Tax=Pontibacter beigongshangensis TaxID=2574733 RepID=UPI00164F2E01|nr:fumarylacetoacetase [Pontibacter beigongshangensis]